MSYAYDAVGNQVAVTDTLGQVTTYAYDALNRVITTTDALSGTAVYAYDAAGNRTRITDAGGHAVTYAYDALNRVITITDALSGTTNYAYNALGQRVAITDTLDNRMTYGYDALGRLTAVTNVLGYTETYAYDAAGNRVSATDVGGHITCYAYDTLDRLAVITDAAGYTTTYTYDAAGNRVAASDPLEHATTFAYDKLNRMVAVTDALGHATTYAYDGTGNRTSVTDAEGVVTHYSYDALNRLVSVTENYVSDASSTAITNVVTIYGYDGLGNRLVVTNALGYATTYVYDALNRLTSVADPLTHTTSYAYDAAGNRVTVTDAKGTVITYTYDALNRLMTITDPDGVVEYAYDAVGNRLTMTDTTGTTTYVYDDLYRLTRVTDAQTQTVCYAYDAVGNRTVITYSNNLSVTYSYDDRSLLETVKDWDGGIISYTYDAAGRLTGVSRPNGTTTSYTYDAANRLTELAHYDGDVLLTRYAYTLDEVGNRVAVTEVVRQPVEEVAALPSGWMLAQDVPLHADAVAAANRLPGLSAWLPAMRDTGTPTATATLEPLPTLTSTLPEQPAPTLTETPAANPTESPTPAATPTGTLSTGPAEPPFTVELIVSPVTLPADGTSRARLTVRMTDEAGNPVANGTEVQFTTSQGRLDSEAVCTWDGRAEAWLTAGKTPGWAKITAVAGEVKGYISVWLVALPENASLINESPASDQVPPFEPTGVAERARHPVSMGQDGRLKGEGGGVTAHFDVGGLSVSRGEKEEKHTLAFELLAVRAGENILFETGKAPPTSFEAQENRAVRVLAKDLFETYVVGDYGVEQIFTLEQLPSTISSGQSLVIEGHLQTELKPRFVSSGEGIVFLDKDGNEALVYSGAMARDAFGRQQPVSMELEGNRVFLALSGEWLAGAVYPVTIDPFVGNPIQVSGASNEQNQPAVAYNPDDDEWLVVWSDYRNSNWDIYGQRVQPDGTLSGSNFAIGVYTDTQRYTDVAYNSNDDEYLVVWSDYRNGTWDIYAQRVLATGSLTGSNLAVITATNAQEIPAVTYNTVSDEYLLVWQDYRNGSNRRIYGQRLSGSSTLLGSSFVISDTTSEQEEADVTYNSTTGTYLVVWQDDVGTTWDIYARRVLSDGTLLGEAVLLSSVDDNAELPRVTYNGNDDEYLVVWQDDRDGNWNIYGQRVSAAGELAGNNLAVSSAIGDETWPSLVWDGRSERYGVGWQGLGLGQRLWADGTLDGDPLDPTSSINSPDSAHGNVSNICLTVGEGLGDIYAQRYGVLVAEFEATPLSGSVPLTVTFTNQSTPLLAIEGYEWNFGDGVTSTITNPTHIYTTTGVYTVSLKTSGGDETDTLTRTNYITVSAAFGDLVTTTISYTYDPLYRLTSATYSGTQAYTYTYAYDAVGNRTVMTDASGVHTYTYDAANRLTNVGGVTYTWDNNGNLLSDGVRTFTYSVAGQLTQVVSGTLTTEFTYNGDGHRVAKTVGGTETRYTLDPAAGLVQVLVETTGGQSTAYLYGHDLLAEEGAAWAWHLGDGLGSVRQLTNGDGDVTLAQGYTPFGVPLWQEGSAASGYGFTGEQQDPSAGLLYLRARYYDPATGRFLTRDPVLGEPTLPQTLNPYVYVVNNPINQVDPSGEIVPLVVVLGGAVVGGLAGGAGYILGAKATGQEINSQALGVAMLTGVVSGGLTPIAAVLLGPIASGMLVGGGANAAQYYFISKVTGQCISHDSLIANTVAGALVGGVSGAFSSSFDKDLLRVARPWVAPPGDTPGARYALGTAFSRGDVWDVVMSAAKRTFYISGFREFARSTIEEFTTNLLAD